MRKWLHMEQAGLRVPNDLEVAARLGYELSSVGSTLYRKILRFLVSGDSANVLASRIVEDMPD